MWRGAASQEGSVGSPVGAFVGHVRLHDVQPGAPGAKGSFLPKAFGVSGPSKEDEAGVDSASIAASSVPPHGHLTYLIPSVSHGDPSGVS